MCFITDWEAAVWSSDMSTITFGRFWPLAASARSGAPPVTAAATSAPSASALSAM